MQKVTQRILSFLMALVLSLSLLPLTGIETQAATVNYNYNGEYVYNWGSRGTTATFLSPMAADFYADNNVSYTTLSNFAGSSDRGSVPSSPLYRELKELMTSNHSYKTSYDATKNLYQYTDCQNGGGKISSFYSGNAIGPAWGQGGWNREHTWPNSKGLGGQDETDIMMLRPTSTSENSSRGNTAYGKSESYYDPNEESGDRYNLHGDVARIMLYTYVRWGNTSKMWGQSGVMESVPVLLEWMEEDPVDTWELGRNDAVEAITGTRNVFVDYPELAFQLFGAEVPVNYTTPSGGVASGVTYTITAISADLAMGTVSVTGRTITATPAAGYEVSGYTLLSGTASVTQSGNRFTVQATSDVTVRINFAQKIPVPTVSSLNTGDQVVIFAPAYNKALSSEIVATHYLQGVDVFESNGTITGYGSTEIWTVTKNSDDTYSFTYGGQKLGMAAEYTSMRPGETNDKWQLISLGGTAYNVKNTVRGNYMEWYADKDNWSTYTSAGDSQFRLSFYVIGKGLLTGGGATPEIPVTPPAQPEQPSQPGTGVGTATKLTTLPQNGDVVIVYNSQKAMGKTLSGTSVAAVDATVNGSALTVTGDMAALTVVTEGNYYIFKLGDLYLTSGSTGKAMSYQGSLTDCARWTMESDGNGAWYITNVGAAYNGSHNQAMEYYHGFTTYGIKQTEIYQMQLFKVDEKPEPEPEIPAPMEKLVAPQVKKNGQKLTWNAVEHADYYEIYRATSKSGKYTLLTSVSDTEYEDRSVAAKTYYYKVKAICQLDETKNSGLSSAVSVIRKCDAPEIACGEDTKGRPVVQWNKIPGAKKYTVYRATSQSGKYSKLGTATKLTYTDSKAKPGNTYYYKVIANASSSKYNSGYSNIVSFACVCATPSVTVKLDTATGKPSLSWKKTDGATKYAIYRQLPGEDFQIIAEQTGTSFKDTTAPIDTVCAYKVQALGKTQTLNGSASKVVSVTSGIAKPALKGSIDAASGKPVITWNAVEGAVAYNVYCSTKSSKSYKLVATVEELAYTDEAVSAGKTYYYKVEAVSESSRSAQSSYVKLTGKCATPEITGENASSGKPYLSWEKVSGAKKYTVYRATSQTGKYTKLGTTTKTYYTDSKAKVGKTYYYKIVANASSSKNNSPYSNIVSRSTNCAAPKLSVNNDAVTGKPVLSWKKVDGAMEYRIYRKLPGESEPYIIDCITKTAYTDQEAPLDARCEYFVQAVHSQQTLSSTYSNTVTATVKFGKVRPACYTGIYGDNPTLLWEHVEGAVRYEVYRATKKTNTMKYYKLLSADADGEAGFTDETAVKGKTYYYKVVAVRENGESSVSSYLKVKVKK